MTDTTSKLFSSDDINEHTRNVLAGEEEPQNEYDRHFQLMWEYFQTYKQQRGEEIDLAEFLDRKELQGEAFDIWNEHGLELAFQGLLSDQRPGKDEEDGEVKTQPDDGTVSETSAPAFVPSITLDDILRRRADIQA
ncbi:MAG: hypothetical protein WDZ82_01565 [Candidatus Paceibacterota bacterium]